MPMAIATILAHIIMVIRKESFSDSHISSADSRKRMLTSFDSIPILFLAKQEYFPRLELDMFIMVNTEKMEILDPSPDFVSVILYISLFVLSNATPSIVHVTLGVGFPET